MTVSLTMIVIIVVTGIVMIDMVITEPLPLSHSAYSPVLGIDFKFRYNILPLLLRDIA